MAGMGQRFKNEGFKEAKPFIRFNGKMMIEHVLDGIKYKDAKFHIVIRESFYSEYKTELELLCDKYDINISSVKGLTKGALCTALSAYEKLEANAPLFVVDSDNIFDNIAFSNFINYSIENQNAGNLLTFCSNENKFSYAKIDEKTNLVIRTKEKEAISNHAIAGAYMFKSASLFVRNAIDTVIYDSDYAEYYMSSVYNTIISKGGSVGIFDISETDFNCVGTPEQLRIYLNSKI